MKKTLPTFRDDLGLLRSSWSRPILTLALAILAAGLAAIFTSIARLQDFYSSMPHFIGCMLLAGILYVIGVFLVDRFELGPTALIIILASAVLFRVTLLRSPLSPSGDVYRYQWDGRVERARLNPYLVSPDSPGLEALKNPEHPEPPGEDTPTIYPPVAEIVYRLIETAPGYKRVSTLLDLASVGLIMMLLSVVKQPLHRVLTYAWNPAVLIAFAMSGHFDSLAIATLLTAFLFLVTNRHALATTALALSFLSKLFPILLLPTFVKRSRPVYLALFGGVVFLFYLPFFGAGWHLLEGAANYARDWLNNASLFHLFLFVTKSKVGAEVLAGLILLGTIIYLAKVRAKPLWSALILLGGVLLVSPTAYPWYFTWSIPFLCFYPSAAWLLMSVTSVLAYTPRIAFGADKPLTHSLLMASLEYGPVYLWLAYNVWRRFKARRLTDASARIA